MWVVMSSLQAIDAGTPRLRPSRENIREVGRATDMGSLSGTRRRSTRSAENDEVHEAVRPCSQGSQYTLWQRRALSPGNPQAQRRQTRRTSASHTDPMHLLLRKPGTTFATAQRQATEVLQNMQRAARLSCS